MYKILSTTLESEKVQSEYVECTTDVAFRAEARREGMSEGMVTKAKEKTKKMRDKGFDIAEICEVTGLSEEEIENL